MQTEEIIADEQFLKRAIRDTEARYIDYKKQLEGLFKDKSFDPKDELVIWLKEFLREQKNSEEGHLKHLRLEMEHLRQGLNPSSFYTGHKIRSEHALADELKKRHENGFISNDEIEYFIKEWQNIQGQ